MGNEHSGDVCADGDVLVLDDLLLDASGVSFPRAVVDEVLDPSVVLADDRVPEKSLVCSPAAIPLIRKPLLDAWKLDGELPDLVHSQLGPQRDLGILWRPLGKLHDLHALEQLLDKAESAVVFAGQ